LDFNFVILQLYWQHLQIVTTWRKPESKLIATLQSLPRTETYSCSLWSTIVKLRCKLQSLLCTCT